MPLVVEYIAQYKCSIMQYLKLCLTINVLIHVVRSIILIALGCFICFLIVVEGPLHVAY